MPQATLNVFRKSTDDAPLKEWLKELKSIEPRAYHSCLSRILELERIGHEMRPPLNRHLGDGIYELRAKKGRVNYRVLYFFCGQNVVCMTHGFTKEGEIPDAEIERANESRKLITADRDKHIQTWEL